MGGIHAITIYASAARRQSHSVREVYFCSKFLMQRAKIDCIKLDFCTCGYAVLLFFFGSELLLWVWYLRSSLKTSHGKNAAGRAGLLRFVSRFVIFEEKDKDHHLFRQPIKLPCGHICTQARPEHVAVDPVEASRAEVRKGNAPEDARCGLKMCTRPFQILVKSRTYCSSCSCVCIHHSR